ncbi:DUF6039 family protein [Streptomyces sp. NBC_00690]|uniref:DUF6039 family protein n=1 Tax=Streptomyces sp. NBC_00690 TaxID=2975808 RepID=UPI002E2BF796|nr:DUF6039 family protein [Streptomyces sp. NBC_00690]
MNDIMKPASHQVDRPEKELLHSGNAGFIISRYAHFKPGHEQEGLNFVSEVLNHMNKADLNGMTFFFFQKAFGDQAKHHWFINMKSPADYAASLEMVDHDETTKILLEDDVVADDRGFGSWGNAVVQGSITEDILVPQHGLDYGEDHTHEAWVPEAWRQTSVPPEEQLNSANAALMVHRVAYARYPTRKEARYYAFAWQNYVNENLRGKVTAYLYEETFGAMDRLHMLIHLASYEAWEELRNLPHRDPQFRKLLEREMISPEKGGGTGAQAFVPGGVTDTLLVPRQL